MDRTSLATKASFERVADRVRVFKYSDLARHAQAEPSGALGGVCVCTEDRTSLPTVRMCVHTGSDVRPNFGLSVCTVIGDVADFGTLSV